MSLAVLSEPAFGSEQRVPAIPRTDRPAIESDDQLFEIDYGQRVEKRVSFYAGWIASRLSHRLGPYVESNQLGEVVTECMFILDREADLQRRPDLAFLSAARLPPFSWDDLGELAIAPNLAVEVASPNDLFRSVLAKVREYFEYGVERVWIVLPEERCVCVFRSPTEMKKLAETDDLADESLFPGWKMPISQLFKPRQPPTT